MLKVCPELPHARQELSPNASSNGLFTKLNWTSVDNSCSLTPVLFARVWVLEGKQEVHWLLGHAEQQSRGCFTAGPGPQYETQNSVF